MEWARKSFHARRAPITISGAPAGKAAAAGRGPEAPRGAVLGMHMYASSWTNDMSATAQRMRGQAREVSGGLLEAKEGVTASVEGQARRE
jgi:hypothetical protein